MQPTIEIVQRHPTANPTTTREHVEAHRENLLFDAIYDACDRAGVSTRALDLLTRIVRDCEGTVAERLIAASARLDRVLADGITVVDGVRVSITVGVAGAHVIAIQDDHGWLVTSARYPLAANAEERG